MPMSAGQARKMLLPLIEQVNNDRDVVEIVSRKGSAVLMSEEYAAWRETAHLFRSPANARRLLDAYERARGPDRGSRARSGGLSAGRAPPVSGR